METVFLLLIVFSDHDAALWDHAGAYSLERTSIMCEPRVDLCADASVTLDLGREESADVDQRLVKLTRELLIPRLCRTLVIHPGPLNCGLQACNASSEISAEGNSSDATVSRAVTGVSAEEAVACRGDFSTHTL